MLLCGIINELKQSIPRSDLLSFFFCQATDPRINTGTSVLRGLLYSLFSQNASLISHIQKKHDHAGKTLFEDTNAWVALSDVLTTTIQVQDRSSKNTYILIDALDECISDLSRLLDFIIQSSATSSHVKWIVSSRNSPNIGERLGWVDQNRIVMSLEINSQSVSCAVDSFIEQKVRQLSDRKRDNEKMQQTVRRHLTLNANNTFLWVALVCENLEATPKWKTATKLQEFPPSLDALCERMMQKLRSMKDAEDIALCKRVLALISTVYRPITLSELASLVEALEDLASDLESLQDIIGTCGSFLTIRDRTIYFVHQSAKDFVVSKASSDTFPIGAPEETHYIIFSRSLQALFKSLRRDMYDLVVPGYLAEHIQQPESDPPTPLRYLVVYWIDHFCDWLHQSAVTATDQLDIGGLLDSFIRNKYL